MEYRALGGSGMQVSRFTLGAMNFPNCLETHEAARVLDEAMERGINLIDTADSYGRSEEVLGEILTAEKRERLFLTTKVYRQFCRDRHVGRNSRVNIIHSYAGPPADMRAALDLLAVKRIDVASMITHRLPLAEAAEGFRLMLEEPEALKIIIAP